MVQRHLAARPHRGPHRTLGKATDWIIDNRDSHPLFLYFFGYISNAVVLSVRAVYLVLLAAGWAASPRRSG